MNFPFTIVYCKSGKLTSLSRVGWYMHVHPRNNNNSLLTFTLMHKARWTRTEVKEAKRMRKIKKDKSIMMIQSCACIL